ncbi:uncharacterized protein LOC126659491 [Mercurialis annua]|uniref:uncharacterized protein LOC126659491 n=1 Tax=Mercurialis annua TaxID=3986 RepID=UPI00215DFAF3|nr:uncharacterized protein LOC126659491 [Mercurialis annua]
MPMGGLSLLFKDDQEQKNINSDDSKIMPTGGLSSLFDDQEQKNINSDDSKITELVVKFEPIKKTGINNSNNNCDKNKFKMPLHFPRYTKEDYEKMSEDEIDRILQDYGLFVNNGDLGYKKQFAIGAFVWPSSTSPAESVGC